MAVGLCAVFTAAQAMPLSGRGDPLLLPLFDHGRQQSFSSAGTGDHGFELQFTFFTVVNHGAVGSVPMRIRRGDGEANTTGRFLVVADTRGFHLEFAPGGVTAFAFNLGRLEQDMTVELFDEGLRPIETFVVRAFGPANNGAYIGAYSPFVPVRRAVFSFPARHEALFIDNVTIDGPPRLQNHPAYIPPRAAGQEIAVARVPDRGGSLVLFALSLLGLLGWRRLRR